MWTGSPNLRRITATALAGAFVCVLAWGGWRALRPASERRVVIVPELKKPVMFGDIKLKPVDMPVALLFDCYENALENVPPRTDTSKRQWSWEAPPLPMDVARRELSKPGANESDKKVLAWLELWEEGWKKDYPTTTDELWRLSPFLSDSRLTQQDLFQIGIAMSFLDGDEHAESWQVTAIRRLMIDNEGNKIESDIIRNECLSHLAQTRALWQRHNYEELASRFKIETTLFPLRSKESRKSSILFAEMLYHQNLIGSASAVALEAERLSASVGDLSASDWNEMHWVVGGFLFRATRYDLALPHLRYSASHEAASRKLQIMPLLALALIRTNQLQEASRVYGEICNKEPSIALLPQIRAEMLARSPHQRLVSHSSETAGKSNDSRRH